MPGSSPRLPCRAPGHPCGPRVSTAPSSGRYGTSLTPRAPRGETPDGTVAFWVQLEGQAWGRFLACRPPLLDCPGPPPGHAEGPILRVAVQGSGGGRSFTRSHSGGGRSGPRTLPGTGALGSCHPQLCARPVLGTEAAAATEALPWGLQLVLRRNQRCQRRNTTISGYKV